jgi:hypothetical protein
MPDLVWWLENFKESAFRLETLPAYSIPEEADMLAAFRRGENVQLSEDHPWPPLVRTQCGAGKTMLRVRVVSQPLTVYERFELSLYPHSIAVGEQIHIAQRDVMPGSHVTTDFWLFDNESVYLLRYDDNGKFLGVDIEHDVVAYRRIRDLALENSVPLSEYAARSTRT